MVVSQLHPTLYFRRVEEEFCMLYIQKMGHSTEYYADFISCYIYINFIWKERIIYLMGENLLMEELRYSTVTEQLFSCEQHCFAGNKLGQCGSVVLIQSSRLCFQVSRCWTEFEKFASLYVGTLFHRNIYYGSDVVQ